MNVNKLVRKKKGRNSGSCIASIGHQVAVSSLSKLGSARERGDLCCYVKDRTRLWVAAVSIRALGSCYCFVSNYSKTYRGKTTI